MHRADNIPVAEPSLSPLEVDYVAESVSSGWVSANGPFTRRVEAALADYHSASSALLVSNGTVALHLSLAALGVGPGDEVVVPSLAYIAAANAVRYVGAEPVFADVDPHSWNISPMSIERLISPQTRAIIAVHNYGLPADLSAIRALADKHHLLVIEDSAEALFATLDGKPIGTWGDLSTFSFFGNKILTCGEGGAIITDSDSLAEKMRILRSQGMSPERRYHFPFVGFNFRMPDVTAALLLAQWERRSELISGRDRVFAEYDAALAGERFLEIQQVPASVKRSPWLYSLLVARESTVSRDTLTSRLADHGIETRPFFEPIHLQPPYIGFRNDGGCPVASDLAARGFSLPTFAHMSDGQIQRVLASLVDALATS